MGIKRYFLLAAGLVTLSMAVHAQNDTIPAAANDSTAVAKADTVEMHPAQEVLDTVTIIDNSSTIDLMRKSANEEMENQMRLSILAEQLEHSDNARQKRALEQQLADLTKADSMRKVRQQQQIDSMKMHAKGAPVTLKQDTIYMIYTKLGSITANERAKLNSDKILTVARMFSMKADSLFIAEGNSTSDIMFNDLIIASITDTDAMWMGDSRESLAEKYKESILESITMYKKSVGFWNILKIIGLCILVIVVQVAMFKGVKYLFQHMVNRMIVSHKDKWFKGLKIRELEVLNAKKQMRAMLALSKGVKWLIYIALLYLSIPIIFSIFPPTQRLAETLFGWVFNPIKSTFIGFFNYLPNLFRIIVTVVVMHYILKFIKYIAKEVETERLVIPGFYPDWTKATFNIIRILTYAFTLVLIFPYLPGSDSQVFQGVSVFMGIIFSLGSTSVISNLIAGMVITYMRPFIKGDRIKIGDTFGDVIEKTPFVIRVLTPKNEVITVPNSTVLSSNVVNYSAKTKNADGLIVNTVVTMGYDTPWQQVNELLIEAALRTVHIESKPQPFMLQLELNDFAATYQINAYTKEASKQAIIYSELHKNIQDVFREAGIEMIMPHYQAIRDGNASTVPPDYEPKKKSPERTHKPAQDKTGKSVETEK